MITIENGKLKAFEMMAAIDFKRFLKFLKHNTVNGFINHQLHKTFKARDKKHIRIFKNIFYQTEALLTINQIVKP